MKSRALLGAHKKGFTLTEILITLAIFFVMASIAVPFSGNFFSGSQFSEETDRLITTVRLARERAVAGYHNARHGIYIDTTPEGRARYTLYEGSSYVSRVSALDEITILDEPFSFSQSADINFFRTSGRATPITFILSHDTEGARSLTITSFGFEL